MKRHVVASSFTSASFAASAIFRRSSLGPRNSWAFSRTRSIELNRDSSPLPRERSSSADAGSPEESDFRRFFFSLGLSVSQTGPGGTIPGATYGTSWYSTEHIPSSSSKSKSSWSTTRNVSALPLRRIPGGAVNENARLHVGLRSSFTTCVRARTPGAAHTVTYGSLSDPSESAETRPRASSTLTCRSVITRSS